MFANVCLSFRAVYEELGKVGDLENQVLCRERVEELEPSIRYCLHKIGKSNLQASELLHIGEMEGPALDLFKAKLEVCLLFNLQASELLHIAFHLRTISNFQTNFLLSPFLFDLSMGINVYG